MSRKSSTIDEGFRDGSPASFYLEEEENEPCSALQRMSHLHVSDYVSSSEDLWSTRSRTDSNRSSATDEDLIQQVSEKQVGRKSSSTLSKLTKKKNTMKQKSKSESDGFIQRGVDIVRASFGKGKKQRASSANISLTTDFETFTAKLYSYPKTFKGYFLLIVNFTGDLPGYNKDRTDLRSFFEDELEYYFKEVVNCTMKEMFEAIETATHEIEAMVAEEHNMQLIVSILSHGEVEGIHTCADKSGFLPETLEESRESKVTSIEDIISKFKHDDNEFRALKGMPKLFFIQACHGFEIVKAAGGPPSYSARRIAEDDENLNYQPTVPVDADLLVLFAATKYNKAFVPNKSGSWLIQTMLDVFKNMGKDHDVEAMLKAVSLAVSEKRCPIYEGEKHEVAIQLPCRQSTLRKNCYLQSR